MASIPARPRHIAIVMDGNGRWAAKRFLPRAVGHERGVQALRLIVQACAERQIECLTVFAFSSENWQRPQEEVGLLMSLLLKALQKEVQALKSAGVRLRVIGDRSQLAPHLQAAMAQAEAETASGLALQLNLAISYGGRWDILQAVQKLARAAALEAQGSAQGEMALNAVSGLFDQLTEDQLAQALSMADQPEPDLIIRTGGELRLSNFLLWQAAYAELYFTDTLWPDFNAASLDLALEDFAGRQRRFGKTPEQAASA